MKTPPVVKEYGTLIAIGAGVALVAGVGLYFLVKKAGAAAVDAAKAVGTAINPVDENNLANQGVAAVVQSISGGADSGGEDSLGGVAARLREWWSGDDDKIKAMLQGSTPSPSSSNLTSGT